MYILWLEFILQHIEICDQQHILNPALKKLDLFIPLIATAVWRPQEMEFYL